MIKIAFFDIDGTLIDMEKKVISEKTIETLQKMKAKGIRICIATGRTAVTLPKFDDIEFDAYLTFNGSYCFCGNETIYSNSITNSDVKTILKNAKRMNRDVSIATKTRVAANGANDVDLKDYYGFAKLELKVADDFDEVANDEVYQIMLGCRKPEYDEILKDTQNAKIAAWWDRAVDIIPLNSGKGAGIKKVLEYFHFTKEEAMAFGDGDNDLEMFEEVGCSVAMGNASENLKKNASHICASVSDDGIYHFCIEQGII